MEAWRKQAEGQLADPTFFADPVRPTPLTGAYRAIGEAVETLMSTRETKQAELEVEAILPKRGNATALGASGVGRDQPLRLKEG